MAPQTRSHTPRSQARGLCSKQTCNRQHQCPVPRATLSTCLYRALMNGCPSTIVCSTEKMSPVCAVACVSSFFAVQCGASKPRCKIKTTQSTSHSTTPPAGCSTRTPSQTSCAHITPVGLVRTVKVRAAGHWQCINGTPPS